MLIRKHYAKRIELVEAVKLEHENKADVIAWCGGELLDGFVLVPTVSGKIAARTGDYIIRNDKGQFFIRMPQHFNLEYGPI